MLERRTLRLPVATWRGTPAELKSLADSVVEVMEPATQKAVQEAEARAYAKYSEDVGRLEEEVAAVDEAIATQFRTWRTQQLWDSTQQAIQFARNMAAATFEFSYTLRSGVQESGRTPDVFSSETMPRHVAGVHMRGSVYADPKASVEIRLQNLPYVYLGLEVESADWLWLNATYSRLAEQLHRGESQLVAALYRPWYLILFSVALWLVSSLLASELLAKLPYPWLQDRPWLGVQVGLLPFLVVLATLAWLYPRFEILHSVVREQTDATRWFLVALVTAGVLWVGRWLLSLARK